MVYVCLYMKSKLITCKPASTSNNGSWENASFSLKHISSPLYYCNTGELMCGVDIICVVCGGLFIC